MPVGTAAYGQGHASEQVRALGADIVLGNVYHLMLRPGAERVAALGGLHSFMRWPHPILTDSGGFQVMSLAKLRKLDESGVTFQSHLDGSKHVHVAGALDRDPGLLGSDIQMQFDECIRLPASEPPRCSAPWSCRCAGPSAPRSAFGAAARQSACSASSRAATIPGPAQVQLGGPHSAMDLKGYAVGGLAVGEPQDVMLKMLEDNPACSCPPKSRAT